MYQIYIDTMDRKL